LQPDFLDDDGQDLDSYEGEYWKYVASGLFTVQQIDNIADPVSGESVIGEIVMINSKVE
jgi:hypothetical protein